MTHPDIGELIGSVLGPSHVDFGALGVQMRRSDMRAQLSAALGKVQPRAAADLMLARYADDEGALQAVEREMLIQMSKWCAKPPRPGLLRALCRAALQQHIRPDPCPECNAHGWVWVDTAREMCMECFGSGRQHDDLDNVLPATAWAGWEQPYVEWVYNRLRTMLRRWEREAKGAVKDQMGWGLDTAC